MRCWPSTTFLASIGITCAPAIRELGDPGKRRDPGCSKTFTVRFDPMALGHYIRGSYAAPSPDQADTLLDLAVVEHDGRAGNCTAIRPERLLISRTAPA